MDLKSEKTELKQTLQRIKFTEGALEEERERLQLAEEKLLHAKQAQDVLQLLAQAVQQQAHKKISEVVSSCLSAVFDDPYEFKVVFERKRGRTEAHLRFLRRGLEVDPLTASGGGMIDVAAFALRVACLVLHRPKLSRVVVLDEPFKFVSSEYRDNVRGMLEGLSKRMNIQFILVTHIEELEIGKVITL